MIREKTVARYEKITQRRGFTVYPTQYEYSVLLCVLSQHIRTLALAAVSANFIELHFCKSSDMSVDVASSRFECTVCTVL